MIKKQEILAITRLSPEDRYKYLIKRVSDFEEIWVLSNEEEGFALNEEKDGRLFMPVWPFKEYTEPCIHGAFKDCSSKKLDIYYFIDEILDTLIQNKIDILAFPIIDGWGLKVDCREFKSDLVSEMEQYE